MAIQSHLKFRGCRKYRWWALGALAALLLAAGGEMVHAGFRSPARLPAWPEPKPGDRILIVAPHPDDEALAAGGLIQRAITRGARVRIVVLTDGDAFRVAAAALAGRRVPRPDDYLRLGAARQRESLSAAAALGVPAAQITFLHYPDKGLAPLWIDRWDAAHPYRSLYTRRDAVPAGAGRASEPYDADDVLHDLRAVIREERPTAVYLPAECDENSDHWATHLFAVTALAQTGLLRSARVATYVIHHQGWPQRWPWQPALAPPPGIPAARWGSFWLTAREARQKAAVVERYRTQTSVMGRRLRAFDAPNEIFERFATAELSAARPASRMTATGSPVTLDQRENGGRLRAFVPVPAPAAPDGTLRFHIRLVGEGRTQDWEFHAGAPAPQGCTIIRGARGWGVTAPAKPAAALVAVWVGAERSSPGVPLSSLGWRLFRLPEATGRTPIRAGLVSAIERLRRKGSWIDTGS